MAIPMETDNFDGSFIFASKDHYERRTNDTDTFQLARGIRAQNNTTKEDILSNIISVLVYKNQQGIRIIGESALNYWQDKSPAIPVNAGLSKKTTWNVYTAGYNEDTTRVKRIKNLVDVERKNINVCINNVFFKETEDFVPIYLGFQIKRDLKNGMVLPYSISTAHGILKDIIDYPESFPNKGRIKEVIRLMSEKDLYNATESDERIKALVDSVGRVGKYIPIKAGKTYSVWINNRLAGTLGEHVFAHSFTAEKLTEEHGFPAKPNHIIPTDPRPFLYSLLPEANCDESEMILEKLLQEGHLRRLMGITITTDSYAPPKEFATISCENDITSYLGEDSLLTNNELVINQAISGMNTEAQLYLKHKRPEMVRLSGVQLKLPGYIDGSTGKNAAYLKISDKDDPFTVIIKPDPKNNHDERKTGLSVIEWAGQEVAKAAGIIVPEYGLWISDDGENSVFLSQRFDLQKERDLSNGDRYYVGKDGLACCGVFSSQIDMKYLLDIRQIWRSFKHHSIEDSEAENFLKRFMLSWAMGDDDLHGKNISILQSIAFDPVSKKFEKNWVTKLSPAYDTVCSKAMPDYSTLTLSLPIEGKKENVTVDDWKKLGCFLNIDGDRVESMLHNITLDVANKAEEIASPDHRIYSLLSGNYKKTIQNLMENAAAVADSRLAEIGLRYDRSRDRVPRYQNQNENARLSLVL